LTLTRTDPPVLTETDPHPLMLTDLTHLVFQR
jgi:hypothetical protein